MPVIIPANGGELMSATLSCPRGSLSEGCKEASVHHHSNASWNPVISSISVFYWIPAFVGMMSFRHILALSNRLFRGSDRVLDSRFRGYECILRKGAIIGQSHKPGSSRSTLAWVSALAGPTNVEAAIKCPNKIDFIGGRMRFRVFGGFLLAILLAFQITGCASGRTDVLLSPQCQRQVQVLGVSLGRQAGNRSLIPLKLSESAGSRRKALFGGFLYYIIQRYSQMTGVGR